jgi:exodeoxyribonuclease VII large subunit
MQDVILSPTDFVALVNQTLEFAYPNVVIEGELCNFRVAKNRWVYFALKDDVSVVQFFGTIYQLPGPLEDGLNVRVLGSPRLHAKFGFSINIISMAPVGEGSIKKAADLLAAKLAAEGLFATERKRSLPEAPQRVGLITAGNSAAYADFVKILNERWGGVEVNFADVYVQGDQAPLSIVRAIEHINQLASPPEVLVITRGGGSAEDLAAFNDERVVRAVAASRIPTVVAIGHEVDESLAELAADARASTPTNAAQLIVPDRKHELTNLKLRRKFFRDEVIDLYESNVQSLGRNKQFLNEQIKRLLEVEMDRLAANRRLNALFDPKAALKRGYAIVRRHGKVVSSAGQISRGDTLSIDLADGKLEVTTNEVINGR